MSISDFAAKEPEKTEPAIWNKPEEPPALDIKPDTVKPADPPKEQAPSGLIVTGQQTTLSAVNTTPQRSQEEILQGIMGQIGETITSSSNLKILIYGDPGSMKSSFTATAPNNLIADLEDGLMAAKFSPHGVAENVKPYPWSGFENFGHLIGALNNKVPELDWVEVLSVDTFSELHKRALAEVTEREWRKRPSTNRFVPEGEHHQENNERMIRMIRALKDLNRDFILTTHAVTVEPKGKPAKTYPDFSEKLANKIEAMMDVVGYAEKRIVEDEEGNKKLCMVVTFRAAEGIHCKTRIPLPTEMINPTFGQIKEIWEESKNA